jgi:hypothetical protein
MLYVLKVVFLYKLTSKRSKQYRLSNEGKGIGLWC